MIQFAKEFDRENTGRIGWEDFLEIMTEMISTRDPTEELVKAFQLFDEDNTGLCKMFANACHLVVQVK